MQRLTAYKLDIKHVLEGKLVKSPGGFEPNYLILKDNRKVSRVRLLGTVVNKYHSEAKEYASIILDDSTETLRCKVYGEDVKKLEPVSEGEVVDVVGRPREGEDGISLTVEEVFRVENPNNELLRKLEIRKLRDRIPLAEKEEEVEGENKLYIESSVIGSG